MDELTSKEKKSMIIKIVIGFIALIVIMIIGLLV